MKDLSIIIPVKDGDDSWKNLYQFFTEHENECEIFFIGNSFENKQDGNIHFIQSKANRAQKLNLGAIRATRQYLWFLHADSEIDENALVAIENSLKKNANTLYYFNLKFIKEKIFFMTLNEWGVYWRCLLFKIPFGDQGFFMKKSLFISLGLYSENAPYGEDHLLIWRAHQRNIALKKVSASIKTSARKYKNNGWLKTTFTHIYLTYKQALPEFCKLFFKKESYSAVAIFVKTPNISPVKTRLAEGIGKKRAQEFFELSLKATEALVIMAVIKSNGTLIPYWAISEKEALVDSRWNSFPAIYQGDGTLGEKLDVIYSYLIKKYQSVFLMGADLPHLQYQNLVEAKKQGDLGHQPFLIGETFDGGFYLFGGRAPVEKEIWTAVEYSSNSTASELIKKIGEEKFTYLSKEFDIDYLDDLKALSEIKNLSSYLDEQILVIDWAKNNLS